MHAERKFDFYLRDILEAMRRILFFTKGKTYKDFLNDAMMRDAVIRNFEVMGESVKHLPFSFQNKNKTLPWQSMYDLRNFIVHEYFDVDYEILWQIIEHDLGDNIHEMEALLHRMHAAH